MSNPLAVAVLTCLDERPMYPYEITATLRHRSKERSIRLNYGSLYSTIKTLDRHGLIRQKHAEREGNRPERTVYEITEAGRAKAVGWLLSIPTKEYPDFEAGLSLLSMVPPAEATRLLNRRLQRLDTQLAEMDTTAKVASESSLPELFIVEYF